MRKTDKKIDKQLRLVLTDVCETALKEIDSFLWLTHLVNYSQFPKSLKVVCVFETNESLAAFMATRSREYLESLIQKQLADITVNLKNMADHISYDTEQNCTHEHNGKWSTRLS
tara:strand:+ start:50872 stop:51213 length:342 start_codon:yes stop_codon:yes gene_type:complete